MWLPTFKYGVERGTYMYQKHIPYSTKISFNAHTLYWHKKFAKFNFAHGASCSPGSSGWSSWMNTPRPGLIIECTSTVFTHVQCTQSSSASARSIYHFLVSLVLACCMPFTAALAYAMAEGDSSDDRDPTGSGKTQGATGKYDCHSSDIKLGCRSRKKRFWISGKTADWWPWATTSTAWQPCVKTCACKNFSVTKFSQGKIIRRKNFCPWCAWAKKAKIFSRWKFPAIRYIVCMYVCINTVSGVLWHTQPLGNKHAYEYLKRNLYVIITCTSWCLVANFKEINIHIFS